MNRITIDTPYGTSLEYQHYEGACYLEGRVQRLPSKDMQQHFEAMKNLEIRDDDIYLATHEKAGTHWAWEIMTMLKKGSVEYDTNPKEYVFLDFRSSEQLANVPSPRILNSHVPPKFIPRGLLEKKSKIIHVQRNPKDLFVSLYHHMMNMKAISVGSETESFGRFLPLVLGTYGIYNNYPWCKYVKEWERFTKEHPDQILNIYYEDLKEDPVREITKMNDFLECGRSAELVEQIADACDFQKMKKANEDGVKDFTKVSGNTKPMFKGMYRKGEVGDWKNWFTVAENERMEAWLKENLVDTDLKFRYEL